MNKSTQLNLYLRTGLFIMLTLSLLMTGCVPKEPTAPLVFYDWQEDMPKSVLDAFTEEYGIKVNYLVYESQEEAIANMKTGQVYDVVVMESRYVPQLVRENLLAELDQRNLTNSKNLSANFRDLAYDPGNHYSIPYNWGTTALIVRSDLIEEPITRWADLWNSRYNGRVGLWLGQRREVIGLALKSLGYSANSEKREELEAALARLLELQPTIVQIEDPNAEWLGLLAKGQVVVTMGLASEVLAGQALNPSINYVLPKEGAMLWNDTFIIPANSPSKYTAELFLNFVLRAEVSAAIANNNHYASPNEAAYPFIEEDVLNNPLIYPPNEDLVNAELILPLTPEGNHLYDEIWKQFLDADPQ